MHITANKIIVTIEVSIPYTVPTQIHNLGIHFTKFPALGVKHRVSEPACFGATPAPGIFYPEPAPAPGKREHNFGIF